MARAIPGQGPYTQLPPRDRQAERQWVRSELQGIKYPDSDDVTGLDGQITNKRLQWESAVDDEYTRRKLVLVNLIREQEGHLGPNNRLVREARRQLTETESQRDRLADRLRGPQPGPGTAVQRVGETELAPPAREDGDVPYQYIGGGFGWGTFFYGIALVIAAAADVAGFYQVLALLLGSWPWILIVLVILCAVGSLFLMHVAGTEFKRFREHGRLWLSLLTITTWSLLGAGAFTVRLTTEETVAAASGAFAVLTGPAAFAAEAAWVKATVFLVVYIASGVLALVGGYATHDRARRQYRQATAAVNRANRRLTKAERKRNQIVATIQQVQDELQQERERWANARKEREAFAAELVALVAIEIRKRVDDAGERVRIDEVDEKRLARMGLDDLDKNRRVAIEGDEQRSPAVRAAELLTGDGVVAPEHDEVRR